MSNIRKRLISLVLKILFILLILLCCFVLGVFINHKVQSKKENSILKPIGQLIEVNGSNMSIYTEGSGDKTIVFMAGSGTASPILDFKSLYSLLSDEYKIVVVEKFGYGFSDDLDRNRDIDTMLEDTRLALKKADIQGPYILCPHSMSGLEALYWADKYPKEVSAIIGLDMAVPEYYVNMDLSTAVKNMKLNRVLRDLGIVRLIAKQQLNMLYSESSLSDSDREIYEALFSQKCISTANINEGMKITENARIVDEVAVSEMPILLFISDGSGGTGFDTETWRSIAINYISQVENGQYIELDCPHYVHNFEYVRIAEEIKAYLSGMK